MMRDAWLLTRLFLTELLGWNRALHTPRGRERAGRVAALAALCVTIPLLLAYLGVLLYFLLRALAMVRMDAFYPGLVHAAIFLMTFVGALLRASGTLYGHRDHDLLCALPVSRGALALSRLARLYVSDACFAALLLLPANIAWALAVHPGVLRAALAFLLMPFAPLLPMVLGAALGLLLSGVARRAGGSGRSLAATFALVALTLALLAGIFWGGWRFDALMETGGTAAIGEWIGRAVAPMRTFLSHDPLSAWYAAALNEGSVPAALGLALLGIAACALLLFFYAPRMERFQKRVAKPRAGRAVRLGGGSGVLRALWMKELRRWASSPMVLLNTGLGYVLAIALGAALAVRGGPILAAVEEAFPIDFGRFIVPGMALVLAFCMGTGNYAASSISLEGRSLWIGKTLPVRGWQLLAAKALAPVTVGLPAAALATALAAPSLSISMTDTALIFLLPTGTLLLCACFGLWLNLRSYRFDWTSETAVVKQSLPAGLSLLAPLAVMLAGAGILALGASLWWLTGGVWLAASLLGALLYRGADRRVLALNG